MYVLNLYQSFSKWLHEQFYLKKLNSPLGYLLLSALAIVLAFVISTLGIKYGLLALVFVIGIPMFLFCLFETHFVKYTR